MTARRTRLTLAAAGPAPFVAGFLAMLNASPGTPAWWMQALALSPWAVAFAMLGVFELCGISDYDRPQRKPEPALVGEVLPPQPARVGAR